MWIKHMRRQLHLRKTKRQRPKDFEKEKTWKLLQTREWVSKFSWKLRRHGEYNFTTKSLHQTNEVMILTKVKKTNETEHIDITKFCLMFYLKTLTHETWFRTENNSIKLYSTEWTWKLGNQRFGNMETWLSQKVPLLDDKIVTLGDLKTQIDNPADSTKMLIGSKIICGTEKKSSSKNLNFFQLRKKF